MTRLDVAAASRLNGATVADQLDDNRPPQFSDEALALRFSEKHGATLRYVAQWGKWLAFDGKRWRFDETLNTTSLVRVICRNASSECNKPSVASSIASAKTVSAVLKLATADRRHASTADAWDSDDWSINTPAGVVDLKTGLIRNHNADDLMIKITTVAPGGACPLWTNFVNAITCGDTELAAYLQRVAGYALTGSTREHALFFCHGAGANGKTVFLNCLTGILGDYASIAPMETFTQTSHDRHPTELARLRGARLITASETEEGRRWAESRIKSLTGGDPITARFMKQDFFTFEPKFKLVFAGNHKPGLRNIDEAIRRRFNLIPFDMKLPASKRDKDLSDKLRAEWPGIFRWAIEGCLEWQRIGLSPPAAVLDATDAFLKDEDAVARWLDECCVVAKGLQIGSSALFASWKAWAENVNEPVGSQKRFSASLISRGFEPARDTRNCACFRGLGLKSPASGIGS